MKITLKHHGGMTAKAARNGSPPAVFCLRKRSTGYVMVVVLLVMSLLVSLATALLIAVRTETENVVVQRSEAQSFVAATTASEWMRQYITNAAVPTSEGTNQADTELLYAFMAMQDGDSVFADDDMFGAQTGANVQVIISRLSTSDGKALFEARTIAESANGTESVTFCFTLKENPRQARVPQSPFEYALFAGEGTSDGQGGLVTYMNQQADYPSYFTSDAHTGSGSTQYNGTMYAMASLYMEDPSLYGQTYWSEAFIKGDLHSNVNAGVIFPHGGRIFVGGDMHNYYMRYGNGTAETRVAIYVMGDLIFHGFPGHMQDFWVDFHVAGRVGVEIGGVIYYDKESARAASPWSQLLAVFDVEALTQNTLDPTDGDTYYTDSFNDANSDWDDPDPTDGVNYWGYGSNYTRTHIDHNVETIYDIVNLSGETTKEGSVATVLYNKLTPYKPQRWSAIDENSSEADGGIFANPELYSDVANYNNIPYSDGTYVVTYSDGAGTYDSDGGGEYIVIESDAAAAPPSTATMMTVPNGRVRFKSTGGFASTLIDQSATITGLEYAEADGNPMQIKQSPHVLYIDTTNGTLDPSDDEDIYLRLDPMRPQENFLKKILPIIGVSTYGKNLRDPNGFVLDESVNLADLGVLDTDANPVEGNVITPDMIKKGLIINKMAYCGTRIDVKNTFNFAPVSFYDADNNPSSTAFWSYLNIIVKGAGSCIFIVPHDIEFEMRMAGDSNNQLFIGQKGWLDIFAKAYPAYNFSDAAPLWNTFYYEVGSFFRDTATNSAKLMLHGEQACEDDNACWYCGDDRYKFGNYNNYLRCEGVYNSDGTWSYPKDPRADTVLVPLTFAEVDLDSNGILSRAESERFSVNYLTGHNVGLLFGLSGDAFENGRSDGSGISFAHNNIYLGDLHTGTLGVFKDYMAQGTVFLGYIYAPDTDVTFPSYVSGRTFWGAVLARNLDMSTHKNNLNFMFIKPLDYYRGREALAYPPEFRVKEDDDSDPTETLNVMSFSLLGYY
jgi:hypothetical protein